MTLEQEVFILAKQWKQKWLNDDSYKRYNKIEDMLLDFLKDYERLKTKCQVVQT